MMTDPIADMLTRIRNGLQARHASVEMPASKIKAAIAEVLKDEGYIKGYSRSGEGPTRTLKVELRYVGKNEPVLSGIKRISKPGLRVYSASNEIPRVYGGLGVAIVSTSRGVMSGAQARKLHGGEVPSGTGSRLVGGEGPHRNDVENRTHADHAARPTSRLRSTRTTRWSSSRRQAARATIARGDEGRERGGCPADRAAVGLPRASLAPRPDPDAGRQHGDGRDRRASPTAGDQRRRLPRDAGRRHGDVPARLLAPGRLRGAAGRHADRRGEQPRRRERGRQGDGRRDGRPHPPDPPPEPYKGKGIKYAEETIRRKAGKAGAKGKK